MVEPSGSRSSGRHLGVSGAGVSLIAGIGLPLARRCCCNCSANELGGAANSTSEAIEVGWVSSVSVTRLLLLDRGTSLSSSWRPGDDERSVLRRLALSNLESIRFGVLEGVSRRTGLSVRRGDPLILRMLFSEPS